MQIRHLTEAELLAQIASARRRTAHKLRTEPHAKAIRFDPRTRLVHITMLNDVVLGVPVGMFPGLESATDAQLKDCSVSPAGWSLRWEQLDADYSVVAITVMALGKKAVSRVAASIAGATKSPAKASAARRNGKLGGRPRKSAK